MALAGRLALVTGGGSGIGRAVCNIFAREGARIAAVDQNKAGVEETIKILGDSHQSYVADISSSAAVNTLFKDVHKSFSAVPTIAVNCAGITRDGFIYDMDEKSFDDVLNVNLKGTFLITQAVARGMAAENLEDGSIINLSSIVAKVGNLGQCNYAASKSGVIGLTKTAAKELAKAGIRCNAVLPGFITTPMTDAVPEKVIQLMLKQIPLQRMGTPEDIADVCLFLASSQSRYVTGTTIEVAGGMFM